jgi:hypothetical protein
MGRVKIRFECLHCTFLNGSLFFVGAALLLLAANCCSAQQADPEGIEQGNYNIKQSVEFGYRFTDVTGSQITYDTFVNLQQGPRLLDFTTEMRSLNHQGAFFDRLFFSNFGYGGDPQNVSRLNISKNKWYDFSALFRRNEYAWDYSLLANPLNPVTPPFANAPAGFTPIINTSPHLYSTRHKLSDFDLLLLPQSRIRLRFGYSRGIFEGPGFSSIHQGTDQLLFQDYKTTLNNYRLGVDFRILPKTNISYDQIWSYYKGDTGTNDQNQLFALSSGALVDIGVILNAGASQPCSNTFLAGGVVNPVCNAYFDYLRHGRTRTNAPTEQLSLQSRDVPEWDLSAKMSYTSGSTNVFDWLENWNGLESKSNTRGETITGPVFGERVAATADFGATWHMTHKLSFIDSFHFSTFHNPVEFDASTCASFGPDLLTPPTVLSPAPALPFSCTAPPGALAGTPAHNPSKSGPDLSFAESSLLLKQEEKTNLAELEYQFSPRLGVRLGFRYRHRAINDKEFEAVSELFLPDNANRGDCTLENGVLPEGCTPNGDGSFTFTTPQPIELDTRQTLINESSGVFGIWAKPLPAWRISFDTELMYADNSFTRISPRQSQEYRLRSTYKPAPWLNVSGSITIWEARNNVPEINNLQHNRFYGFSASMQPKESLGLELGYDYNDVFSQILICYVTSVPPPGISQCPGSSLAQQLSTYTNLSHYGYFAANWSPLKRLTLHLGANLTGTNGSVLILSPNAPSGPLNSFWAQPVAGFEYRFTKGWTGKAYWGYHGYHEDETAGTPQDIFVPRNFHANLVTLSLRYAF